MNPLSNETNAEAYLAQLPELRKKFPIGYYALFAGAALVGAYATYSDALTHGYETAGKSPFFVKQISTINEDIQSVLSPFTVS